MESKSNISGENFNHKNCSYCNKPFTEELWCKKCDPFRIMEGWTSGNSDIDEFIKDTMYNARDNEYAFLKWVPFDRFTDIKEIGEVMYGSWKKELKPQEVALKKLKGSQNMSDNYLNQLEIHWEITDELGLEFTKDPETKEFTFSNLLPKPVNSSIITSYVNNEYIDDECKVDDLVN
ncbi:uncharacterized protein OCT59_021214 [Rhizophagus irregularis]|uniref:uncharacterized protein n=1 Tax=Rhizophagus irregularis TaxID=588596 RepID=UPI0033201D13|nr:hypothetical protein OCT59_021214 [Rhizophagus irregularis]